MSACTPSSHRANTLLDLCEAAAGARLVGSRFADLLPGEKVADLFCGAGGWGEGAKRLGIRVDYAVNHDAVAIGAHEANNPGCKHHRGDAWKTRPRDVVGKATLGILFASAACTTHSRARGSAPISQRVHMLGWCIARWMEDVAPRIVLIENVPEWKDWGPTVVGADGVRRQDPARKGQHFRRWWRFCERLGYVMEMRVLDAPDYGAACRRKRLFIVARRDGAPIVWPEKTHGEHVACAGGRRSRGHDVDGGQRSATETKVPLRRGGRDSRDHGSSVTLRTYRTAAECIDWSDLGSSIFERTRPLKDKTLGRIAEGIRRYVLNHPAPFVLRVTHGDGGGWHVAGVGEPLRTQTTRQDLAVVTAVGAPVVQVIRGDVSGRDVRESLPTITAGNGPGRGAGAGHAMGIATPILATTGYGEREGQAARVNRVGDQLGTCVNGAKQALVSALLMNNTTHHTGGRVDGALPTVTTGGQAGLVAPVFAHFRHGGGQHQRVDEPGATPTSGGNHAALVAALLVEFYGSGSGKSGRSMRGPMGTPTTLDRHGLVGVVCVIGGTEYVIVDILFRMLRPRELAKAMGFPDEYRWPATQRDCVRLIGNAVQVDQAAALVGAVLPRRRIERKAGVA